MSHIGSIIQFLHACCCYQVKDTWPRVIKKGAFAKWPSLTYENVNKHLNSLPITSKAHIKQVQQQKSMFNTSSSKQIRTEHEITKKHQTV